MQYLEFYLKRAHIKKRFPKNQNITNSEDLVTAINVILLYV